MIRTCLTALAALLLLWQSAFAAKLTEKQRCLLHVSDVTESMESDETPEPGAMTRVHVESLVEIATAMCEKGKYQYAERLLELARGMVVSE